jgi:hypothetical protein
VVAFGRAAGAAFEDDAPAAALLLGRFDLRLLEGARKALLLPFWAVVDSFLVLLASFLAARAATCSAFI